MQKLIVELIVETEAVSQVKKVKKLIIYGNLSSGQIYEWRIIPLLMMGIYTVQVRYTSGGSFYH